MRIFLQKTTVEITTGAHVVTLNLYQNRESP